MQPFFIDLFSTAPAPLGSKKSCPHTLFVKYVALFCSEVAIKGFHFLYTLFLEE